MDIEDFNSLDSKYHEAMKEQEILRNFETALIAKTKDLINQYYPDEIHHLSAQGYLQLEKVIGNHAGRLILDISTIIYKEDER